MSNIRVSESAAALAAAAKGIMEDAVLLAQRDEEIKHLKQKCGRLEAQLQDKDKRLREFKESLDRRRALNPSMVNLIEDKWKREVKDKDKLKTKVEAEGKALLQKAEAVAEPKTKKWVDSENSADKQFREEEKKWDAVFESECAKIGKRVRDQFRASPGKDGDGDETPREKGTSLDTDGSDNDEPAPKQAKKKGKEEKEAKPKPKPKPKPAAAAAASSSSTGQGRPKGGKANAKPDPKPKPASKGITKPAGPKGKKERKGPRTWYAIWMAHNDTKEKYAAEFEEVKASGDPEALKAFPQPIKNWYCESKTKISEEEHARFKSLAKQEEEEWVAKGWVRPAKVTKAGGKKKATKKDKEEEEEEDGSGSDSDDDQDAPMEEESEDEAEEMDQDSGDDDEAAKAATAPDKTAKGKGKGKPEAEEAAVAESGGGDKEEEQGGQGEEEEEDDEAEPHPGTLGIKATVNKKKKEEEPDSDAGGDSDDDHKEPEPKQAKTKGKEANEGENDSDDDSDDDDDGPNSPSQ